MGNLLEANPTVPKASAQLIKVCVCKMGNELGQAGIYLMAFSNLGHHIQVNHCQAFLENAHRRLIKFGFIKGKRLKM